MKEKITMADLAFRVQHVIKTEIDVTVAQLSRNNIEMLFGVASFVDPHTIRVEPAAGLRRLSGRNRRRSPPGPSRPCRRKVPINGRNIINSDQVLEMT